MFGEDVHIDPGQERANILSPLRGSMCFWRVMRSSRTSTLAMRSLLILIRVHSR